MDEQPIAGTEPDEPPSSGPDTAPALDETADLTGERAEPLWRPRTPRILRPWEVIERLDRQWEDRTPLRELPRPIDALALTIPDDPRGWDYLGVLTGASSRETANACAAWLAAQLAADAVALGRAVRPRVELVPAGRLWYVVRTIADVIVVIDGPGFATPLAAALAASRRYRAELLRELERERRADSASPDPAEGSARDGTAEDRAEDGLEGDEPEPDGDPDASDPDPAD